MSEISLSAVEKRTKIVESLITATEHNRMNWRRVSEDTFESVIKERGFRLINEEYYLHLIVSQFGGQFGLDGWSVDFRVDGRADGDDSESKALNRLWKSILDNYDTIKADELIEFLTGSKVIQ